MTQQEYAGIAAACDRLLRAPGTSLARLSIPLLHFLNEHPSVLSQYAPPLTQHPVARLCSVPRALIRAIRALARSPIAPHPSRIFQTRIDVLIISHLLSPNQLHQDSDFYFGDLQSELQERGLTSLLVLVNHLPIGPSKKGTPPCAFPRLVLPTLVPLTTEVNIWKQCAAAARELRREAACARDFTDRSLAILASRQALAASTITNLRMHAALAHLCQQASPNIVITTYEGTVAERLIWHAARTAKRRPLCVGYQHATMLERAHAIRRPVAAPGIDCDPDVVLTLGEITHALLAGSRELNTVRFITYGSHRRATLPVLPQPQHRPRRCLVLADASEQESVALFDFALACSPLCPDISFVLRPHPMVDIQALLRRHPKLRALPQNVTLSYNLPLEQEFSQSRYCLYRGSSAALHAVRACIKPYYLEQPGELPVDCLFALAEWRETVSTPQDLAHRLRLGDPFADFAAAARAADMCERYVCPVRPAAIDELLETATAAAHAAQRQIRSDVDPFAGRKTAAV